MSRETQIKWVGGVVIDITFPITSAISTFAIYDCAGILQAFLVDQSFVRMYTPPEKSQYVASTFAVQTRKKPRFFKGVFSDGVNNIVFLTVMWGILSFILFRRARGRSGMDNVK